MTAFNNSFLDDISIKIINENNVDDIKNITVVLPSRRAGIYFKKILSKQLDQTFFLPNIITINEFIIQISDCEIINGFEAELELYSCYKKINENLLTYQILRKSISKIIMDIYENTKKNIDKLEFKFLKDVRDHSNFVVSMSDEMKSNCLSVKDFLYQNVYNHKSLLIKRKKAEKIIIKLFNYFEDNPNKLPDDWKNKQNNAIERNICDYVSGMTDRYASRLYKSIYE